MKKSYKFYRNFAIICGVLFLFAAVVFVIGSIKFLMLNPYGNEGDNLRRILAAAEIFQVYLAYLIIGCYKRWKMQIRYRAYARRENKNKKLNAEYSAFIKTHLN